MMMHDGMVLTLVLAGLLFAWLPAAGLLCGLRARRGRDGVGRARALLHRRLAAGEIDIEEYPERDSALPAAEPGRRR